MSAEAANKIATTIVALKTNFSKPRFVWYTPPSDPPKAPPIPASDGCRMTPIMRIPDSTICIHGNA